MTWANLQSRVSNCTACEISKQCNKTVFGAGDTAAKIMIIGEAPGKDEDAQGVPFVDAAGQELQSWIWEAGFRDPAEFFVTNILKCWPTNNRNPTVQEIMNCMPYLMEQVEAIDPVVIVTVGKIASNVVVADEFPSDLSMKSLRGDYHTWNNIVVRCIYHPAYYLRNKDEGIRLQAIADLVLAKEIVDGEKNLPF